jgi:hypothetical protein
MSEYFLAPALAQLRDEVNARFPGRDKASDGWIGDPSHAARKSDHNPCWSCRGRSEGIVRALDIDISPDGRVKVDLRKRLLRVVVGDPRVWYVISNGKIYSRTYGFRPRAYTYGDPHEHHVHISLNGANGVDPSGNFRIGNWFPQRRTARPRRREPWRKEHFRQTRPNWDIKVLDRAIRNGRHDLRRFVNSIEQDVQAIDNDIKNDNVQAFLNGFKRDRVLKLHLLNDLPSQFTKVLRVRDRLRSTIKQVLR